MDVIERLDALAGAVAQAKPRALGAGVIVDRDELLALIEDIRTTLPSQLHAAGDILARADEVRQHAQDDADRIIAAAHDQSEHLVSQDAVTTHAHERAGQIIDAAGAEAASKAAEVDAYVANKLLEFQRSLESTLEAVVRGRQKLEQTIDLAQQQPHHDQVHESS